MKTVIFFVFAIFISTYSYYVYTFSAQQVDSNNWYKQMQVKYKDKLPIRKKLGTHAYEDWVDLFYESVGRDGFGVSLSFFEVDELWNIKFQPEKFESFSEDLANSNIDKLYERIKIDEQQEKQFLEIVNDKNNYGCIYFSEYEEVCEFNRPKKLMEYYFYKLLYHFNKNEIQETLTIVKKMQSLVDSYQNNSVSLVNAMRLLEMKMILAQVYFLLDKNDLIYQHLNKDHQFGIKLAMEFEKFSWVYFLEQTTYKETNPFEKLFWDFDETKRDAYTRLNYFNTFCDEFIKNPDARIIETEHKSFFEMLVYNPVGYGHNLNAKVTFSKYAQKYIQYNRFFKSMNQIELP